MATTTSDTNTLVIEAKSAGFLGGDFARITINGFKIFVNKNSNGTCRGLHIVIIDQNTGVVTYS